MYFVIAIKMPPPPPFVLLAWGPSQVWPVSQCPRYFSGRSWYTANSISDIFHYTTSGAWDPLGKKDGQVPCRWIYFGFKTVFHGVSLVCWLCFTRPTRGIENSVSARQSQETSLSFTRQNDLSFAEFAQYNWHADSSFIRDSGVESGSALGVILLREHANGKDSWRIQANIDGFTFDNLEKKPKMGFSVRCFRLSGAPESLAH